ncbi:uncharacterized protein LOC135690706 [Rhopilema esculentum]|uniref:uncharacterized protein LOC135690706 n=1 Tax=Rhopilema esculentum TaxID=499914 RepID=UPI0031DF8555
MDCRLCVFLVWFVLTNEVSCLLPGKMIHLFRSQTSTKRRNCSIHRSAIVREILTKDFFPIFDKYGVEVPKKCKLNKDRDIFKWIEQNKTYVDGLSLQCELCGKQFYQQFSLYEHAKRKHSDVFFNAPNAVCLADFCDIFKCDLHEKYPHNIPDALDCNKKHVDNLRRQCEAIMRSCLPEKLFFYVYDKLYMAICSTLTCEKFLHPFKDSVSVFTVVTLSITVPISVFILAHICLYLIDNMESVDEDKKFMQTQRARYEARNAELNARFYSRRTNGMEPRHRKTNRYMRLNR